MIFLDMLKPNLTRTFSNNNIENSKLDDFLKLFGGTSFVNSYTPACETYRSLSCVQTGKLPKFSGVENRMDIYEGKNSIKDILNNNGFTSCVIGDLSGIYSNVYDNFSDKKIPISNDINNIESITNLIKYNSLYEKNFIFLGLELAHQIRNDILGKSAGKLILENVGDLLNKIFLSLNKDIFDYIVIFSDHGYVDNIKNDLFMIDDDRSKIFLHIRKKYQNSLIIDKNLRCICDIFETVRYVINDKRNIENIFGKNLFHTQGHNYIPIEDYKLWDYNGFYYQTFPTVWGIKEKNHLFSTNIIKDIYISNNEDICLLNENRKKYYYEILKNETVYFKKFLSYYNISISLKNNDEIFLYYINGKKRKVNLMIKIYLCLKQKEILLCMKLIIKYFLEKVRKKNEKFNFK